MTNILPQAYVDVLTEVRARKHVWQRFRAGLNKKHALDFNVFDFLRRDELGLSEVLRWLLDPGASHGQGDTFLKEFLDGCDIQSLQTECAVAECEVATNAIEENQRRIDVQVRCGAFVLAIENKPFASYQREQLRDYLRHLDKVAPQNHCLVILNSGDGANPDDQLTPQQWDELSKAGRVVRRTWNALGDWVGRCEARCEAPRVRQMLSEFRDYVHAQFGNGGRMPDREFIIESVLADPAKVSASLELLSLREEIQEAVFRGFVQELDRAASAKGWKASFDESLPNWPVIVDFGDPDWAFGLEFEWTSGKPFFGLIAKKRTKNAKPPEAKLAAIEGVLGKSRPNGWLWPWWQHFDKATIPGLEPTDFASVWGAVHEKSRLIEWTTSQCARAKEALA